MATALELGPEGCKPYIEALRQRPERVLTPEEIAAREALIAKAREAAAMLKQEYGATRVVLFGSLAHKAWFHKGTDVDLAVEGIPPDHFYRACAAVDHIIPDVLVDVIDLRTSHSSVKRSIHREGIEL